MGQISKEEYEKAKERVEIALGGMALSRERFNKLFDEIVEEKKIHDSYAKIITDNRLIILAYETYQDVIRREEGRKAAKKKKGER